MCGIAGFNFRDETIIKKMNDSQAHRGPDGEGLFIDDFVSLGHRRLAIIDLSKDANQPMHYKNLTIVFNGEIYNYREIKKTLSKKGHSFYTQSDTEVILHAYEEWGTDCLKYFNGMWAFCLYDKNSHELFLSRDRFGIKPLFYFIDNERFIFSSEIKAIKCHEINLSINQTAVNHYFYQKYIGRGQTIYNEIQKLEEAHYIQYNLTTRELLTKKYYHLENEIETAKSVNFKEKKKLISELICDSVEKRLISDVPVGSFLSGGIDSSVISSIIAKKHPHFKVFSIGFNEDTFNELDHAKIVAAKISASHHYHTLSIDEELIFDIIEKIDEPFGDPSLIPTYLLSKITREKVTVSLSGDAGDELFAGYDTYLAWKIARFIPPFLVNLLKRTVNILPASDKNLHISFKIKKFIKDWHKNEQIRHLNWMSQTDSEQRKKLLNKNYIPINKLVRTTDSSGLLSIQLNDFRNYLSNDILVKVDSATMMNSLEARIPFLDFRLVPLVLSLSPNQKIRRFKTKFFLKKFALNLVPKKIINRKKAGFSVPLSLWFKKSSRIQEVITNKQFFEHGFFDFNFVQKLFQEHLNSKSDNSRVLWLIFVFNLWYKKQKK